MTPPKPSKPHRNRPPRGEPPGGAGAQGPLEGTRPQRRWLMRLAAVLLMPALILGALELGLRAAGFGHPAGFLIAQTIDGRDFLYTNHRFTFRFFPPAVARAVSPQRISVPQPADTFRIVIFGESAAMGDPEPAYSFGRHLEVLLEERFPGTNFEVVCTAITAVNSHVILPIARTCARVEADLWIVYMGNNEMIGPYGAGTIFGSKAPPLAFVRASLAIQATRLGQLLKALSGGLAGDSADRGDWAGINMFADNLLQPDDPGRLRVYDNFRGNLQDILLAGRQARIPVLLSTVASNLRDCAPFASLHAEGLTPAQLDQWNAFYANGKALEAAHSWPEALQQYAQAAAIDADFAELQFRIGRCHGLSGNLDAAKRALEKARDADALAVRADTRINRIIREAAGRHGAGQVVLVDAAELLAGESPGGIPGRELFYEHVHFTLQGNYQLARILGERVLGELPQRIREADTNSWAGPGTCQRKLAVTLWDNNRLWTEMLERLSTPPYTSREANAASLAHCQAQADEFSARINSRMDRIIYESALRERPDDYHLHARFGRYLELNGQLPEAIRELQWVTAAFPGFEGGHQELGIALLLAKRYPEAQESFRRVLEINPAYAKARQALQLIPAAAPP